jgi:peptide/nickel transport system ATP-binding protein
MLVVDGISKSYRARGAWPMRRAAPRAVLHDVSLRIAAGESVGLVGGSGSGKSTLARIVLGLERPDAGRVLFEGQDVHALRVRDRRGRIQAVFQDPVGSLDPRMRAGAIVAEPLLMLRPHLSRAELHSRVGALLEAVALPADAAGRYPHAFSGGQRQRIAIARALATRPALVVADEPVSALDVSVQAQVLALIADLRTRFGMAWLFIGHDLRVVRAVADRVLVLHEGRVVEEGAADTVLSAPRHPYTRALVEAAAR